MIIGKYDFLVSDDCDITRFAEVSTVLKFILLGMRDPVIPFAMYREIVKMLNDKEMSENEKIEMNIELLKRDWSGKFKDCNKDTLYYVLDLCYKTCSDAASTIDFETGGYLVGKNICRPYKNKISEIKDQKMSYINTGLMAKEYEKIFESLR
jgi:hypothetical protein